MKARKWPLIDKIDDLRSTLIMVLVVGTSALMLPSDLQQELWKVVSFPFSPDFYDVPPPTEANPSTGSILHMDLLVFTNMAKMALWASVPLIILTILARWKR